MSHKKFIHLKKTNNKDINGLESDRNTYIYFCYFHSFAKTKTSLQLGKPSKAFQKEIVFHFLKTHWIIGFFNTSSKRTHLWKIVKDYRPKERPKESLCSVCLEARKKSFVWVVSHQRVLMKS